MSDEVSDFLRSVEQLNHRRDEDDEARAREREEKILQQRRERQARREGTCSLPSLAFGLGVVPFTLDGEQTTHRPPPRLTLRHISQPRCSCFSPLPQCWKQLSPSQFRGLAYMFLFLFIAWRLTS